MNKRQNSVAEQSLRRIEVLARWSNEGVPEGQRVPSSLTQVRLWCDPRLGIDPIGSPSSFTTRHPVHGVNVRWIQRLLGDLKRPHDSSSAALKKVSTKRRLYELQTRYAELEQRLVTAANQYAKLTAELDEAHRDLKIVTQSLEYADQKVREMEQQVRELERELARARARHFSQAQR